MFQILAVMALLAAAVALSVVAVRGVVQMYRDRDRGGAVSGGIAGMLTEIDRAARPSVQYIVEARDAVQIDEDDVGGE
jgi:hypothetical protein